MMSPSDEIKSRRRWFQFDLRLLFALIAIVCLVLAFEVARRSRKTEGKLRDAFSVSNAVYVLRGEGGNVTIYYGSSLVRGEPGTITEIGEDFIVIRLEGENVEALIPVSRISRVLRDLPSAPPAAKTPVPQKTV